MTQTIDKTLGRITDRLEVSGEKNTRISGEARIGFIEIPAKAQEVMWSLREPLTEQDTEDIKDFKRSMTQLSEAWGEATEKLNSVRIETPYSEDKVGRITDRLEVSGESNPRVK